MCTYIHIDFVYLSICIQFIISGYLRVLQDLYKRNYLNENSVNISQKVGYYKIVQNKLYRLLHLFIHKQFKINKCITLIKCNQIKKAKLNENCSNSFTVRVI